MGRITVEVSDEIGLMLPEACPLHKHKLMLEGSLAKYFKHRVGTDDEADDGAQYAEWNYNTGTDYKLNYVSNGSASGGNPEGYGSLKITSDSIGTFSLNVIDVVVHLTKINWTYTKEEISKNVSPSSLPYTGGDVHWWYDVYYYYEDSSDSRITKSVYLTDISEWYATASYGQNNSAEAQEHDIYFNGNYVGTVTIAGNPNVVSEDS